MLRYAALSLLLTLPASAVELFSGVSREILIPAQDEQTLFVDFTFTAPAGARWAIVEATTGNPSADIDLFARFGRRVTAANGGEIFADYSSQTPAGGDEHIFINSLSAPPLQTGVYYLGLLVSSVDLEFRVTLKVTVELGGEQRSFLVSTFDAGDAEGWTLNFPGSGLPGASAGDANASLSTPAGVLRIVDFEGPNRDFVVAPPKFLGDLGQFANPRFELDLRFGEGPLPLFPIEMRLLGAGSAYRWRGPVPEPEQFLRVEIPLDPSVWSPIAGAAPFSEVLRNVSAIELSMDHAVGPEVNDLDYFAFRGDPPDPPAPGAGGMPGLSDFESGLDGWTRNFPASAIPGASIGTENAAVRVGLGGFDSSDGFLLMIDGDGRDQDWAVAPTKFIEGISALDRPWYEFRYRRIDGEFPFHGVRLHLLGGGSIYEWTGARPRETWERFQVPVDSRFWTLFSGPDDWNNMLQNLQRLEISMDLAFGAEVNGLDDFNLRTQYTAPVGRALQVNRNSIEVQVTQGGAPPQPEALIVTATGDELVWRAAVDPPQTPWLELSKAAGNTPDQTELRFLPDAVPPGLYEADVLITTDELGVRSQRIQVVFIVGADPRVPLLSQGGAVHAADPLLPLSPGALGSLFGQFLAAENQAVGLEPEADRLPTSAGGVELKLYRTDGAFIARAPLLFVGPTQMNFQTPYEAAGLDTVLLAVRRDERESNRLAVPLAAAAPGIFTLANGLAAVLNQDGSLNSAEKPARAGRFVTVFFSGAGAVEPALPSGRIAPVAPLSIPSGALAATVAETDARILGAALTPNFVGLAQLSLEISSGLGVGQRTLRISINGRRSNTVTVWLAAP